MTGALDRYLHRRYDEVLFNATHASVSVHVRLGYSQEPATNLLKERAFPPKVFLENAFDILGKSKIFLIFSDNVARAKALLTPVSNAGAPGFWMGKFASLSRGIPLSTAIPILTQYSSISNPYSNLGVCVVLRIFHTLGVAGFTLVYIDENSVMSLRLMSLCTHHILTSSTLSFWGYGGERKRVRFPWSRIPLSSIVYSPEPMGVGVSNFRCFSCQHFDVSWRGVF